MPNFSCIQVKSSIRMRKLFGFHMNVLVTSSAFVHLVRSQQVTGHNSFALIVIIQYCRQGIPYFTCPQQRKLFMMISGLGFAGDQHIVSRTG
ncbi:hypothetical protein EV421DRAFT_1850140 [Armillaria borealis]|uniref:Uncharacterized protein n=1 Tax=Armillaria borealis TaxID=47425 RepID=A0AA39IXC6_9AGAR|nr:hypothetical protein EV421DRAFT_1850140 [Armillaria borealis]